VTQEFRLVSYKRGHFVGPLKRESENASAAIASCAKEKDFHNRTSSLTIAALAEDLGRPVLTANQAAFWYALRQFVSPAQIDRNMLHGWPP
jgi:maleate cis-trans isomerase